MRMSYAVIVLIGLAFALAWYFASARRKKLRAWAEASGFRFDPRSNRSFDDCYPSFGCLRRGHSRSASNVSEGTRHARPVVAFDYRYVTGHGKNRQVHSFSGVIVDSEIPLRPLYIRSENLFDKIGEFLGVDDIDFESAEFSRVFHVKSPDRRWAYDVLHQRTMEFLLSMPRFSIEFGEGSMLAWRNRRFAPETFDDAIAVAEGILNRLPGYVVREGGER